MNTTIVVSNMIEIQLACQLLLMPPAVVYRYSPDYAETQELQVLSMSCQEIDLKTHTEQLQRHHTQTSQNGGESM
jgi:hypothetical protein